MIEIKIKLFDNPGIKTYEIKDSRGRKSLKAGTAKNKAHKDLMIAGRRKKVSRPV